MSLTPSSPENKNDLLLYSGVCGPSACLSCCSATLFRSGLLCQDVIQSKALFGSLANHMVGRAPKRALSSGFIILFILNSRVSFAPFYRDVITSRLTSTCIGSVISPGKVLKHSWTGLKFACWMLDSQFRRVYLPF